jgi:hypothetical protein
MNRAVNGKIFLLDMLNLAHFRQPLLVSGSFIRFNTPNYQLETVAWLGERWQDNG